MGKRYGTYPLSRKNFTISGLACAQATMRGVLLYLSLQSTGMPSDSADRRDSISPCRIASYICTYWWSMGGEGGLDER